MPKTATVRISASLRRDLERACKASGEDPDAFAADAIRRQVALAEWKQISKTLRREMRKRFGRDLTEEEIFRLVS